MVAAVELDTEAILSGTQAVTMLGIHLVTLKRYIERGWLRAKKYGEGKGAHYEILYDDLVAFLENEVHWHRWQPERVQERGWREWLEEMREGVVWLSTQQVAERLGYNDRHVAYLIRKGWLKAKLDGKSWRVLESDLIAYDPNAGRGRLTEKQQVQIAQLVLLGYRAAGIARMLNQPYEAVREYAVSLKEHLPDGS